MAVLASIVIKKRWWVRPYLWLLSTFAATFSLFMNEDDLKAWLEREAEWIAKHGIKFELVEK